MTTIWEYVEGRAVGGTALWRASMHRAGQLLDGRIDWNPAYGTAPPRECMLLAVALLTYGLAHERRADPATIDDIGIAVWVASRSMRQGRLDLGGLLRAAGHDVPEPAPMGGFDRDPVIAAWQHLVNDPGWSPAADILSDLRTAPTLPEAFVEIIRVFGDPAGSGSW